MTFVSYAQNFEDVMLWRALQLVGSGFYIDVGAAWPDEHSVTKAFYDNGWRGINIEPNPAFYAKLQEHRPRDINLRLAVSDRETHEVMNFLGDTGLSTLDDSIAEKHRQAGWSLDRQQVQVSTLTRLWEQHVPLGQEVHFLKVDVEGMEEAVLRGNDWTKNRPWVVVVEATLPMSQVESYDTWDSILTSANYHLAYVDGLNRFYVVGGQERLLAAFKYPPNVFDRFVLSTQQQAETEACLSKTQAHEAEAKVQQAEAKVQQAEATVTELEARVEWLKNEWDASKQKYDALNLQSSKLRETLDAFEAKLEQASSELSSVYGSRSWWLTLPLRWASRQVSEIRRQGLFGRAKEISRKIAKRIINRLFAFVAVRPGIRRWASLILGYFGLKNAANTMIAKYIMRLNVTNASGSRYGLTADRVEHLSPVARRIYNELDKEFNANSERFD